MFADLALTFSPGCSYGHFTCFMALGFLVSFVAAVIPTAASGTRKEPELLLLKKISSMVNRSLDLTTILENALDEIMNLLGVEAGAFRIGSMPDVPTPVAVYRGFSKDTLSALDGVQQHGTPLQQQLASNDPVIVENYANRGGADSLIAALRREGLSFLALYPVRSGIRTLGTLALASRHCQAISDRQEDLIHAITEIVGVALLNEQLREQANKMCEDLEALQEVNKIISLGLNLGDIIRRIVVAGKRFIKSSQCHLFLLDERSQSLVGSASTQTGDLDIHSLEFKLSEPSVACTALLERRAIAVTGTDRDYGAGQSAINALAWRSAIFVPLLAKDRAIGLLVCSEDSKERNYTQEEIWRAETLAQQAAIALENVRLFQVVSRSQREWETTFDAMSDCVSVHDTKGKIIRGNIALARRLKTTPQKIIGKDCSELYDPEGSSQDPCHHIDSLASGGLIVEEVGLPAMGGTFQISVCPWYDKNNRLAGSIHVAKDITKEKMLQQQLIQSEKLSALGELISGIAHELNNPLAGVMGYSQLMQLRKDLDERARDSLSKINSLALRCQKIVQNLLYFARKQKPERTFSDINDILEKTVELRSYELQVNNIEIIRDLDANLPKTVADAHQLAQVFLNVITNAEQAMLEAHRRGRLTIRTRADTQHKLIVVEIADDGPGIPEGYLTKIFDPFFTTKEVGKGTGLGLSLSYGMIKEHGGNIFARSRVGEGSTFVIELPVIFKLPESPALPHELMPQALQFENLVRDKRILVVDDERYILDFFVEVFKMFPLQVDTADNGRTAMEKIQESQYDLIITDFKMPEMSGKELLDWIRNTCPDLAGRIIFVTGDTVSAETRSFFERTGSRYLAKPFKIEEVKEVIQQTLECGREHRT